MVAQTFLSVQTPAPPGMSVPPISHFGRAEHTFERIFLRTPSQTTQIPNGKFAKSLKSGKMDDDRKMVG